MNAPRKLAANPGRRCRPAQSRSAGV